MLSETDPACKEIIKQAKALNIMGDPANAVDHLGKVTLADGAVTGAHVVHAVDAVITDGTEVVMINRSNEPGKGQPALPGGFIDPTRNGAESAKKAATREAFEEAGIHLEGVSVTPVGTRHFDRPFDVRIAQGGRMQSHGIPDGDVFLVSTQAMLFDVPDLARTTLIAGDDAVPGSARRVAVDSITSKTVGIPDHADLIHEAVAQRKHREPTPSAVERERLRREKRPRSQEQG